MNRKTKKWLIVLGGIILLVFLLFKLNETFKVVELTSINVEAVAPLDKNKVNVFQGFYSINRKSDSEIFQYYGMAKALFDKHDTGEIKTEYGENDFLVIYDNKYYFQFRQFCTNRNDYYRYRLKFYKKAGKIYLKVDDGEMKFDKQMNLMSDAGKLRCNVPIDVKKGLYNGVELK